MKAIIFILAFFSLVWAKEPSAFELQSGITKQEVKDIKNRAESQSNKIFELESRTKQLETSLEGLKSLYEGQSTSLKEVYDKTITNENITKDEFATLQEQVSNNTKNIQILTDSLKNISVSIEQINKILNDEFKKDDNANKNDNKDTRYVARDSRDSSVIDSRDSKDSTKSMESTDSIDSTDSTQDSDKNSNKNTQNNSEQKNIIFKKDTTKRGDIFKEARSLTYKKRFDEAIARYNWFIEIDYKKAESNYMLGNIAYEQNRYNDAIYYYKESAILDDKADYMPRLLLNSANSFRVLKDTENAKKFYNSLISLFPETSEAKEATRQLNKLK